MNLKFFLKPGENRDEAEDLLFKALSSQRSGDIHKETFPDKEMEKSAKALKAFYSHHLDNMMQEIQEVLDDSKKENS